MIKLGIVALCLPLAACLGSQGKSNKHNSHQGGKHEHHDHGHKHGGRLAIVDKTNTKLHIIDLKNNSSVGELRLLNLPLLLHASADHRYAIATNHLQHSTQIFDGGLYKWLHDDHYHYEAEAPKRIKDIEGTKPIHFRSHEQRSALFFDGDKGRVNAKVVSFSDAEITPDKNNQTHERVLNLNNAMHGTAEPVGDYLLATQNPSEQKLPSKVELFHYKTASSSYVSEKTFATACPRLHGSFSTEKASMFGCSDGVLLISRDKNGKFIDQKIANPAGLARDIVDSKGNPAKARVGSFKGNAHNNLVAAWASGWLYAFDVQNKKLTKVDWTGGDATAKYKTNYMDATGSVLLVLDTAGNVHLLDAKHNFKHLAKIKVLATVPPRISFSSNPLNGDVYLVNAAKKQIEVINIKHQELEKPIALDYVPSAAVWLGYTEDEEHHHH